MPQGAGRALHWRRGDAGGGRAHGSGGLEPRECVWQVEDALRQRSCTECLQWCADNRAKLRKTKSTLEFQLRLQEYIELIRGGQLAQALAYTRKHLIAFMDTHAADIQRVRPRGPQGRGRMARRRARSKGEKKGEGPGPVPVKGRGPCGLQGRGPRARPR